MCTDVLTDFCIVKRQQREGRKLETEDKLLLNNIGSFGPYYDLRDPGKVAALDR